MRVENVLHVRFSSIKIEQFQKRKTYTSSPIYTTMLQVPRHSDRKRGRYCFSKSDVGAWLFEEFCRPPKGAVLVGSKPH